MRILSWNVRGLNSPNKQQAIKSYCNNIHCGFIALLETKVRQQNVERVYRNLFYGWGSYINNLHCHLGRVWLFWNLQNYDVKILESSDQFVHCLATELNEKIEFYITLVYAANGLQHRKLLWKDISVISGSIDKAWVVVGDFNAIRVPEERTKPTDQKEMDDFNAFIHNCDLIEMASSGGEFTWTNKQEGGARIYSRLDRCLINNTWLMKIDTKAWS